MIQYVDSMMYETNLEIC